ncbi:MAG: polysaccharide deacetylase family protein [Andreesenia angusta]|nr:polysaccharide deacetylase family protein [Andreesenia angusta]
MRKLILKTLILILILSFFNQKESKVIQNEIPILMYHDISLDPLKTNKICLTKDRFERDLNYLQNNGYKTISFKDLIDYKEGRKSLPDKPVIITFDDGRPGVYKYAYPLLKERNMKMTFFVIGKRLEQKSEDKKYGEYINWNQAKEMYDSGLIEIQPHTYDMHYFRESLTRGVGVLPLKEETKEDHYYRFRDDTIKIMAQIKKKTGSDSYVFSYPYGKKNDNNDRVIRDLGFKASVITNTRYADISNSLFNLRRINIPSHIELRELLNRVKNLDNKKA